jgi:hypothetical protein
MSVLGEDEIAVNLDIEDAAAASYQPRRGTGDLLQLGRQPGSPRLVVSLTAIFDRDIHLSSPVTDSPHENTVNSAVLDHSVERNAWPRIQYVWPTIRTAVPY